MSADLVPLEELLIRAGGPFDYKINIDMSNVERLIKELYDQIKTLRKDYTSIQDEIVNKVSVDIFETKIEQMEKLLRSEKSERDDLENKLQNLSEKVGMHRFTTKEPTVLSSKISIPVIGSLSNIKSVRHDECEPDNELYIELKQVYVKTPIEKGYEEKHIDDGKICVIDGQVHILSQKLSSFCGFQSKSEMDSVRSLMSESDTEKDDENIDENDKFTSDKPIQQPLFNHAKPNQLVAPGRKRPLSPMAKLKIPLNLTAYEFESLTPASIAEIITKKRNSLSCQQIARLIAELSISMPLDDIPEVVDKVADNLEGDETKKVVSELSAYMDDEIMTKVVSKIGDKLVDGHFTQLIKYISKRAASDQVTEILSKLLGESDLISSSKILTNISNSISPQQIASIIYELSKGIDQDQAKYIIKIISQNVSKDRLQEIANELHNKIDDVSPKAQSRTMKNLVTSYETCKRIINGEYVNFDCSRTPADSEPASDEENDEQDSDIYVDTINDENSLAHTRSQDEEDHMKMGSKVDEQDNEEYKNSNVIEINRKECIDSVGVDGKNYEQENDPNHNKNNSGHIEEATCEKSVDHPTSTGDPQQAVNKLISCDFSIEQDLGSFVNIQKHVECLEKRIDKLEISFTDINNRFSFSTLNKSTEVDERKLDEKHVPHETSTSKVNHLKSDSTHEEENHGHIISQAGVYLNTNEPMEQFMDSSKVGITRGLTRLKKQNENSMSHTKASFIQVINKNQMRTDKAIKSNIPQISEKHDKLKSEIENKLKQSLTASESALTFSDGVSPSTARVEDLACIKTLLPAIQNLKVDANGQADIQPIIDMLNSHEYMITNITGRIIAQEKRKFITSEQLDDALSKIDIMNDNFVSISNQFNDNISQIKDIRKDLIKFVDDQNSNEKRQPFIELHEGIDSSGAGIKKVTENFDKLNMDLAAIRAAVDTLRTYTEDSSSNLEEIRKHIDSVREELVTYERKFKQSNTSVTERTDRNSDLIVNMQKVLERLGESIDDIKTRQNGGNNVASYNLNNLVSSKNIKTKLQSVKSEGSMVKIPLDTIENESVTEFKEPMMQNRQTSPVIKEHLFTEVDENEELQPEITRSFNQPQQQATGLSKSILKNEKVLKAHIRRTGNRKNPSNTKKLMTLMPKLIC